MYDKATQQVDITEDLQTGKILTKHGVKQSDSISPKVAYSNDGRNI